MPLNEWPKVFEPDCGSLLSISVFDCDAADWEKLLGLVRMHYQFEYSEDGRQLVLPKYSDIQTRRTDAAITLKVVLGTFTANAHFFSDDQIEINILPEDVKTADQANSAFSLMANLSSALNKDVYLVPEYASASPAELKKMAVCSVHAGMPEVFYHPPSLRQYP